MSIWTKNKKTIIIAGVILLVGITLLVFVRGDEDTWIKDANGQWVMHGNPEVKDFESCAQKYMVMESYPERCAIPNGPTFTKEY